MLYNPPTGSTDPNASFVGKSTAAGTQGSRIPPKAVEMPQREIVNTEVEAGLSPTNDDPKQLLRAIRSGMLWSYTAAGNANALTIAPITPHTTLFKGLGFRVFPTASNTGAVTLAVNLISPAPLLRRDGSALLAGDIAAGVPFDCVCDGLGNFRLVSFAQSEVPRLVSAPTLYVRTDGNDGNTGATNDAGHAFATINGALVAAAKLYTLGSGITIQLGIPGTYAMPSTLSGVLGLLTLQGDMANQAGYILSGAGPAVGSGSCIGSGGSRISLRGLTLQNTGTINHTLSSDAGGSVVLENVSLTNTVTNPSYSHMVATGGASIQIKGGCTISGSMANALNATVGNISIAFDATLTVIGNPNFGFAFANAQSGGSVTVGVSAAISGSATGTRYSATLNGVLNVSGQGANVFPGSVAGSTATGGQYA